MHKKRFTTREIAMLLKDYRDMRADGGGEPHAFSEDEFVAYLQTVEENKEYEIRLSVFDESAVEEALEAWAGDNERRLAVLNRVQNQRMEQDGVLFTITKE